MSGELVGKSEREAEAPASFAELNGATNDPCRRCGDRATHSVSVRVGKLEARSGQVAAHKTRLCEKCAVGLFVQVRKVMR